MLRKSAFLMILLCSFAATAQHSLVLQPSPAQGMDAQLRFQYPSQTAGTLKDFKAIKWTCGGVPCGSRGLLKFDLDTIINKNAVVDSAFLFLYHNPTSADLGHSNGSGSNATWLRVVTSPWDEATVTLNTQPSYDTANQYLIPNTVTGVENFRIPVGEVVQTMLDTSHGNHGWIMMLDNETAFRSMIFASSDHPDALIRPRLEVYYHISSGLNLATIETSEMKVYPNPARLEANLEWTEVLSAPADLKVLDFSGKCVNKEMVAPGTNSYKLDIQNLNPGQYIIQMVNQDTYMLVKLVVMPKA